ncbi:glucose 1-dehydrogenase [Nisaea acidiphila]|uniref:Glucose 1-dehydrogenase n=1 Tax=Nisaea acidiphila TaxID=1862145 RepID=A0A9J7ASX6_9PROT|nr:glucose 1-dehydrogenase [Nisaea acidiphila]UUX50278.1 glucose 1-dehydrogenase [Nisaea acidiphila]
MRLKDRTAIVTGAASGIGKAIALRFAEEGAHVIVADLTDMPREGGDKTLDLIRSAGGSAEFVELDVASWDSVDAAVGFSVSRYGALDIIVNNAAIGVSKALLETSEEEWDRVMGVNAKGVFFGCKRAVQQMLTQPARDGVRGRIVNISSQHGMIRSPHDLAYGTGKAAVVYMTRQIAGDYAKDGIVCNAVAPGKILTGKTGPAIDPDILAYSEARTPWPRLGLPSDVANAVLFLASDEATYITGENLMIDGGWMAN